MNPWEDTYVTATAQVKCTCGGSEKIRLKVKDHKRYIRGLAQANSTDNELDGTFKGCSNRSSGKCVPKLGEWKFVKRDVLLAGFPVLLKSSKNYCETGRGTIYFVDDGQNPSPQLSGIGAVGAKEILPAQVQNKKSAIDDFCKMCGLCKNPKKGVKQRLGYSEEFWEKRKDKWIQPLKGGYDKTPAYDCRKFGSERKTYDETTKKEIINRRRYHAGIDFYGEPGREVLAVADGVIIHFSPKFYKKSQPIYVRNDDGSIVRYCEIKALIKEGRVFQGQIIGELMDNGGRKPFNCMLHFEVFDGSCEGSLTISTNKSYKYVPAKKYRSYERRPDLIDPTGVMQLRVIK